MDEEEAVKIVKKINKYKDDNKSSSLLSDEEKKVLEGLMKRAL